MKFVPVIFFVACACSTGGGDAPADGNRFGAPLSAGTAIPVGQVLAAPESFVDKTLLVSGTVRNVCQMSGCWLELTEGDAKNGCRVTFKNYGFFVPKDAQGATATVEGVVAVKTLPKSEVDHLESDGATFASKLPDGGARQIGIVASGVELRRN